jgi:hypothetical protein
VSVAGILGDAGGAENTHLGAYPWMCYTQALLIQYFELSSMLWSVSIAWTLYQAFIKENVEYSAMRIQQHMKKYCLVCFGIPTVMTILPFFTMSYGDSGGWCWIRSNNGGYVDDIWRFVTWYIPLLAGITFNCYVYYQIQKKLKLMFQSADGETPASSSSTLKRMKFYPLVLIICNAPGAINALYMLVSGANFVFWLNILHIIGAASQGYMNAAVYGLTPAVKDGVMDVLRGCTGDDSGEEQRAHMISSNSSSQADSSTVIRMDTAIDADDANLNTADILIDEEHNELANAGVLR